MKELNMSKTKTDQEFTTPEEFHNLLARQFQGEGYEVVLPPSDKKGYEFELRNKSQVIAVQARSNAGKCSIAQIEKFLNFLGTSEARQRFTEGWFVVANGYASTVYQWAMAEKLTNIRIGTYENGRVVWIYPDNEGQESAKQKRKKFEDYTYIGVFTSKGGVGKTTVAAHLAGAFALMGHDVVLLDLDPDRNLKKLFLRDPDVIDDDASMYVPPITPDSEGATITVLGLEEWYAEGKPDAKLVICDCSPVLSENPINIVGLFDYCIIPTLLTPLGIAKNGDVILRTFHHIRRYNQKALLFAMINSYISDQEERNALLIDHLQKHLRKYLRSDKKAKFIHPDQVKIRHSLSLLYWGEHIINKSKPRLAFRSGGRSYPLADFLQLASYLEDKTELEDLRKEE
ncbi:MAG: ParA family protein [Acidobacteria bacterium]|nr:ParA family protein [Acidobacteriota bacterium]